MGDGFDTNTYGSTILWFWKVIELLLQKIVANRFAHFNHKKKYSITIWSIYGIFSALVTANLYWTIVTK